MPLGGRTLGPAYELGSEEDSIANWDVRMSGGRGGAGGGGSDFVHLRFTMRTGILRS